MGIFKKVFYIFLIGVFLFSLFSVPQVSAQGMVHCGLTETVNSEGVVKKACTFCDFFVLFDTYLDGLLTITLPAIAGLMIAIGGLYYFFSQGNPEKLAAAKKVFTSVGIGLLIVYSAWLIVNTFFLVIGINEWRGFDGGWWQIDCPTTAPASSSSNSAPADGDSSDGEIVPNPSVTPLDTVTEEAEPPPDSESVLTPGELQENFDNMQDLLGVEPDDSVVDHSTSGGD